MIRHAFLLSVFSALFLPQPNPSPAGRGESSGEPLERRVRLVDKRTSEPLVGLEVTIVTGDEPRQPVLPAARRLAPWLDSILDFIEERLSPRASRVAVTGDDGVARWSGGERILDVRIAGGAWAYVGDGVRVPPDGSVPTVALARAGTVSGRVADEMGYPVAGAEIAAVSMTGESGRPPWLATQLKDAKVVALTDEGGRFVLPPLPDGLLVHAVATKSGFAPELSGLVSVREGRESAIAVPIQIREDVPLPVRVIGEDGAPVPLARILWGDPAHNLYVFGETSRTAITGPDGRATISRGTSRERLLVVSAPGLATKKVGPVPESDFPIEVVLEEPASISGRIVDSRGEPCSGAHVSAWSDDDETSSFFPFPSLSTDSSGRFRFDGLAPGAYLVSASLDGPRLRARVTIPPDATDLELVAPCGEIRGVAVDAATGEPITVEKNERSFLPAAWIVADSGSGTMCQGKLVESGPGEFVVSGLDEGEYRVSVWVDGYRLTSSAPVRVSSAETVTGLRVPLEKAAAIRGVDDDAATGNPVEGAAVSASRGRWRDPESDCFLYSTEDFVFSSHGSTDSEGLFSLAAQATGLFSLSVRHEAYSEASLDVLVVGGEEPADVRVAVEPPLSLAGTVSRGGVPVPKARVFGPGTIGATMTDDEGRFRLPLSGPGPLLVAFRAGEGPTQYAELVVPPGGLEADLEFAPDDAGIAGCARFSGGPAAHARIELLRLAGPGMSPSRSSLRVHVAGDRADENGEFEIGGLSPGDYLVTIHDATAYGRTIRGLVRVPEAGFARCDLAAEESRLVVRPVDAAGGPVVETVSVSLEPLDEILPRGRHYVEWIGGEAAGGVVAIEGLLPGRYRVHARTKAGLSGSRDATVPGEPLVVALGGRARVTVSLRADGGPPVQALAVFLPRPEGPPVEVRAQGDLCPGSYDVIVAARGFPTVRTGTVNLEAGEEIEIVAEAPAAAGRLTFVPETSLPPGTRVSIVDGSGADLAWLAGEFPAFTLSPGDYTIVVESPLGRLVERSVTIGAGDGVTVPVGVR